MLRPSSPDGTIPFVLFGIAEWLIPSVLCNGQSGCSEGDYDYDYNWMRVQDTTSSRDDDLPVCHNGYYALTEPSIANYDTDPVPKTFNIDIFDHTDVTCVWTLATPDGQDDNAFYAAAWEGAFLGYVDCRPTYSLLPCFKRTRKQAECDKLNERSFGTAKMACFWPDPIS